MQCYRFGLEVFLVDCFGVAATDMASGKPLENALHDVVTTGLVDTFDDPATAGGICGSQPFDTTSGTWQVVVIILAHTFHSYLNIITAR